MTSSFFGNSKKIANDFLQNIVFIDDRAYLNEKKKNEHEFDVAQISSVFAKSQKICAVYQPETSRDIDDFAILAKKADVAVLDWRIDLQAEVEEDGNDEQDAEDIDPRGQHTLKIIREILSDPITGKGSLKLILIYTGETDLPGITEAIYKDLEKQNIQNLHIEDCVVRTENINIITLAKYNGEGQFKHNPELRSKIVQYKDLPDLILTKFTEKTSGLLSNFVLQSLTAIRSNTFRLIKLYAKELDTSFLAHRLLLPNPEDVKEHLTEMLTHSIEAVLNYNRTGESVSTDQIEAWIKTRKFTGKIISISNKDIVVDSAFIKIWTKEGFVEACKLRWTEKVFGDLTDNQIEKFVKKERDLHKEASHLLRELDESEDIDSQFSMLTHHKSNLKQPSSAPKLTLGTLMRQGSSEGTENLEERYYLCIQARCDSVRVQSLRKFLFLQLEVADGNSKFQFVVDDNGFKRLRVKKDVYELRTIKFEPNTEHATVLAVEDGSDYLFKSNHHETFQWLADLKEAHAQREINNLAAKLSRVGLDESEWLRRWST